jgi:hypothetical protein
MIIHRVAVIAAMAALFTALPGCAPSRQLSPESVGAQSGIHERLLEAISRDGFEYSTFSQRDGPEQLDVINIKLSLDSLKGRHLSLEKLMTDIGRVCAQPGYEHLPVRIRIGADDEDDQMYLYAVLATTVKGRDNITLIPVTDSRNEVIITIRHPAFGGN